MIATPRTIGDPNMNLRIPPLARRLPLHAFLLAFTHSLQADTPWTVPDPATTEHPGAEESPASSPLTYPDEEGFVTRRQTVMEGVADGDLGTWRRGYFTGGDPGKYLPGHAMARLLIGKEDPDIRRYYNDDRSVREHYHFAALNWGRFLPIFGEYILTEEKLTELAERAAGYTAYHSGGGTENHVTQWRTQLPVLPHYLEGSGMIGRRSKDQVTRDGREWLREYVKGIFAAGNGEWDSSTYIMFTMNGLMNIYDFSPDEEARLIAKAGLDWFSTAYALKYRDGIFAAPQQRGFADQPHGSIADQTGYIWFGSNAPVTAADTRGWRYTSHAATSGYRPNGVIVNLARKNLPELPATFHNTKPNYWGTSGNPRPSVYHETVHLGETFTLSSLWNGHGGQISRMSVIVDTPEGGIAFSGGHPRQSDHNGNKRGTGFGDGTGRYTQTAQSGAALISLSHAPEDEEHTYAYFRMPLDTELQTLPNQDGGGTPWYVARVGDTFVAVLPIGDGEPEIVREGEGRREVQYLKIPGRTAGFVLQVLEEADPARVANAFMQAQLNTDGLAENMEVTYTDPEGTSLMMRFNPDPNGEMHGNRAAHAEINGEEVTFGTRPVYDGPYVHQADGVLTVNDGREGFVIDFTGDLPVYKPWTP